MEPTSEPAATIHVERRGDADYHAHANGDRRYWACGRSAREAVGDLVLSHPELFGVRVEWPRETETCDG